MQFCDDCGSMMVSRDGEMVCQNDDCGATTERDEALAAEFESTTEQTGDVGEFLASDSGVTRDIVDEIESDAEEGRVGHTQKVAAARNDDFEPRILRRSEGVSTSHDGALNFTSIQRGIEAFTEVRKAMNEDHDVPDEENGIVDYLTAHARGNYLVPPRELRALPPARP